LVVANVIALRVMSRAFAIPPVVPLDQQRGQTFTALVELMQRLLAPDGCPWDREQDEHTLRKYVLEEACELIDAINSGDSAEVQDELGDLALQVVFLAELGRKRRTFGPDDVMRSICTKLVRRHPHVFGATTAATAGEVVTEWERIKEEEHGGERGLLDGVPRSFPALLRATREQALAARVGFDWPSAKELRVKVNEELDELDEAVAQGDAAGAHEEFGDLMFALANWARHSGIDAESALRATCDKFRARFAHVEARVKERGGWPRDEKGKPTTGIPLDDLESYYQESKRLARD
jgi:tetrapyrrole methylase family protein/MazG family protein/ATP diphosphatase